MKPQLSLLSWLSIAVLLGVVLAGGMVSVYSTAVTMHYDRDVSSVGILPTFICWVDLPLRARTFCLGNVIVVDRQYRNELRRELAADPDAYSGERFRAFGLSVPLVALADMRPEWKGGWLGPPERVADTGHRDVENRYPWSFVSLVHENGGER